MIKVLFPKGTVINKDVLEELKNLFASSYGLKEVKINEELDTYNKVQEIKIVDPSDKKKTLISNWKRSKY